VAVPRDTPLIPHHVGSRELNKIAPPPVPPRALFVTRGSFSHINAQLEAALRRVRPDLEIQSFDVTQALKTDRMAQLRCLLGVQREYGLSSWRSRDTARYRVMRSQSYYREARALLRRRFAGENFAFTLQTQSLINAALPGTPNFVYTDHVARASCGEMQAALSEPSAGWWAREREIYDEAAHVFTFGPKIRNMLTTGYGIPASKTSAIGAGASVVPKRPVDETLTRYAARNIVFVGIDWERKGGPELVAAFRALRRRLPDATLTIIGCRPEVTEPGVTVLGRLPLAEVEEHYHAASCFCMPSRLEPFGIVFIEAMQFGLPVVATDVSDIGAIVAAGETGRLAAPGDTAALAQALYDTLRDPTQCQAMGRASRRRATQFTWDAVARRILARAMEEARAGAFDLEPSW